jgi:hypothetical protein
VGLENSGKTTLFYSLSQSFRHTASSMIKNECTLVLPLQSSHSSSSENLSNDASSSHSSSFSSPGSSLSTVKLIDLPGNPNFLGDFDQIIDQNLHSIRSICFVVDPYNVQDSSMWSKASQRLYKLLIDRRIVQNRIPFLIVFSKEDMWNPSNDQKILEQKLNEFTQKLENAM